MSRTVRVLLLVAALLSVVNLSLAQDIVQIPEAEIQFDLAVQSFDAGEYDAAYQGFRKVVDSFELNRKTTAARLMAGKSLYRMGEYENAIDALERFVRAFPGSRYEEPARTTIAYAKQALDHVREMSEVQNVGVLLPTTVDDISLTQALFNGFRMAVDEHNADADGRDLIRMIFAPSTGSLEQAFQDFADAGVTAVFGPLYSDGAQEAAALAESREIVMLTPLATDEEVSDGRRFVFQGNPTPTIRGRLMARFAIQSLTMNELGVIAEYGNDLSERMAEGFQDEVERLGAELRFMRMLNGTSGWFRLADDMKDDSLAGLDAIYLPITGGQAPSIIKAALDNLDRLELPIKLLGNKEWDELPSRTQPSKYSATYTNDYHVNPADSLVSQFRVRYDSLAGESASQLSFVGYDMGRYLTRLLTANRGTLADRLRSAAPYQGLAIKIDFAGGNVNQAMFYQRYRNGRIEVLR